MFFDDLTFMNEAAQFGAGKGVRVLVDNEASE